MLNNKNNAEGFLYNTPTRQIFEKMWVDLEFDKILKWNVITIYSVASLINGLSDFAN